MPKVRTTTVARAPRGQAMVEIAMSVPFLTLILISVLFFCKYFLMAQVILGAAQEGAKIASRTPNLVDETTRDTVRGFTVDGQATNSGSVIYAGLGSANLLSSGFTGNLPPGSKVEILPWDSDGSAGDTIPAGTVEVRIDYPFELLGNPFVGPGQVVSVAPIKFGNFTITQRATCAQEVYQHN